jgi:hypothetical protein
MILAINKDVLGIKPAKIINLIKIVGSPNELQIPK